MPNSKLHLAKQLLFPPNIITSLRILLIPGVMLVMARDSPMSAFIAAMLFGTASITDAVDGYLARRYNMVSMVGKFLDPLADKLIVMGTLLMLLQLGRVSAWIVFVILAREFIITTLRILAMGEGLVIQARELGKQKTALQMLGIWCLIVHFSYPVFDFLTDELVSFHRLGSYLLYISVVFSVLSAGDYFIGFFRAVRENELKQAG